MQAGGNLSQFGVRAGGGDTHEASPGDDGGAHIHLVLIRSCALDDGLAFAGEDGLVNGQFGVLDDLPISWHAFSGVQDDEVMGHEFVHLDFLAGAIADDGGGGFEQGLEGGVGLLGADFLDKAQDGVYDDDGHDDGEIAKLTDEEGDGGGEEDDIDQGVFELGEEDGPGGWWFGGRQDVRAMFAPLFQDLGRG